MSHFLDVSYLRKEELNLTSLLFCRYNFGSSGSDGQLTSAPVNDAEWHSLKITVSLTTISMEVDGKSSSVSSNLTPQATSIVDLLENSENIFLGGVTSQYYSGKSMLFSGGHKFYKGCLDEVRVGDVLLPFHTDIDQGG